MNDGMGDDIPI